MSVEQGREVDAIVGFLQRIGLGVAREEVGPDSFLPGLAVRAGVLLIDEARLKYSGDLLHEAGHLAVMTSAEREACNGDAGPDGGAEMAAIAWSYAAALEIGLDPQVVFHAGGYKSGGAAIVENFAQGRYIGVPLLQWFGLTTDLTRRGEMRGEETVCYPKMMRWIRE
jgi:hypothetical protein